MQRLQLRRFGLVLMLLGIIAIVTSDVLHAGGVRRRLTIRSVPDGAQVYVDGHRIGKTPISTSFTYYGTREIRLVKEGYKTIIEMERLRTPWYDLPGVDFISENFIPGEIHNDHLREYKLEPQVVVPRNILIRRAEQFRNESRVGAPIMAPVMQPMQSMPFEQQMPPTQSIQGQQIPPGQFSSPGVPPAGALQGSPTMAPLQPLAPIRPPVSAPGIAPPSAYTRPPMQPPEAYGRRIQPLPRP